MKKVICFDSWTAGSHHFVRLTGQFQKHGFKLLLIHIGSWGHDQARPREEMIGDLLVRDISFYGKKSFDQILELENPVALLFLSTRAFAHMTINRYAKHRKIITCHLYHGLVNVQAVAKGQRSYEINIFQHIQMLLERAWKNVYYLLPNYIQSLFVTKAPSRAWMDLLIEISIKVFGRISERVLLDTRTTIGCVYVKADVEHMSRRYGLSLDQIRVVGNPDLAMFKLKPNDAAAFTISSESATREIIYIDTALSKSGVVFASDEDFVQHLIFTKKSLDILGFRLVVKLHPAHIHSGEVQQVLNSCCIELCSNDDFVNRLKRCVAAIAEPSSAAIIPAYLGKPLLLAKYGKLAGQLYGDVLTSYPRARLLERLDKLNYILDEEKKLLSFNSLQQWIIENTGPLPSEDMPKRVVEEIVQLVNLTELSCVD